MANQNYPVIPEMRIKTDVLSTDSTVKLSSILWYVQSDGTEVSLTSAAFGTAGVAYGVFEPRTSRQEFFKWDPSTISTGATTGITISLRGLPYGSDYTTESTARKFAHPAGSKILLFTDYGAFWNTFTNKTNTETITEAWTFSSTPVITNAPTLNTQAANKAYVDGVAVAGAPDANTTTKGIVEIATGAELAAGTGTGGTGATVVAAGSSFKNTSAGAGDANKVPVLNASGVLDTSFLPDPLSRTADQLQITTDPDSSNDPVRRSYLWSESEIFRAAGTSGEAITAGDALYLKASDSRLYKTTTGANEGSYSFVGFAINTTLAAAATQYYTRPNGIVTGLSGLTAGSYYFLNGTAGQISVVPAATRSVRIGQALSTTTLRTIEPKFFASGTITLSGTGDTTVTTGFYPQYISLRCWGVAGNSASLSIGDDGSNSYSFYMPPTGTSGDASTRSTGIYARDSGGTTTGSVSSRSQTGFVFNCATKGTTNSPVVQYVAWSI